MGTRTAVFQEQEDGTYLGFYVHYDGYPEGVGETLYNHYSNREKVKKLIDEKCPLSALGKLNIIIDNADSFEMRKEDSDLGHQFCVRSGHSDRKEYFKAKSLEQIRKETYLTLNGQDEVKGFTSIENDEFIFKAYQGSDNNGYLYVQDINGQWLISEYEEDSYTFKPFELL
ncbi:hypothetical protein [Mammaliicoccus sp. E-M21]|uniref:hypothetical protein n=1 Tax=Mammaliicoccus sp. E-M21 TaxID=2898681 RepID=UPI001EFB65E5|nr:hypothetical protein [Mammaliicoccus sp. E-M21]